MKKWDSTVDLKMGPTTAKSPVLTTEEEAIIVAFRKNTLFGRR